MAMYCTKCEKEIETREKPCPHCGYLSETTITIHLLVGIVLLLVSLVSFYMIYLSINLKASLAFLFFILGTASLIYAIILFSNFKNLPKKAKELEQKLLTHKNAILSTISSAYNSTYANITAPPNPHLIYLENSEHCNCWVDSATLYITTSIEKLTERINNNPDLYSMFLETPYLFTLYQIPIDNIEYFNVVGDMYTETRIQGGGTNLGGAILGGAIAGTAGAVVGSRSSIKSETIKHDERIIELKYNESGQLKTVLLDKTAEPILKQLIPEKEYSYIMFQRNRA